MRMHLALPLFLFISGTTIGQSKPIQVGGSDTMILFAQKCSNLYKLENKQDFTIRGGGIENGFKQQTEGKIDIVQNDGTAQGHGNGIPIGVHSIVFYVNSSNPVNDLSLAQIRGIFLGKIKNWKEVGGPDQPISLFAGESTSGILDFFQEFVLQGEEPYPFWGKSTAKELVETIAGDKNSIGYSSYIESKDTKKVRIKPALGTTGVEPSLNNIRALKYPIARYVYWHVSSNANSSTHAFANWVLSTRGQLVVESIGYEPLLPDDRNKGIQTLSKILGAGPQKSGN